jgi:hypothetical protein
MGGIEACVAELAGVDSELRHRNRRAFLEPAAAMTHVALGTRRGPLCLWRETPNVK